MFGIGWRRIIWRGSFWDAVAGMDLGEFYGAYCRDGAGRRPYDPAMVVALFLYSYARGVRSARADRAGVSGTMWRVGVIAMLEQV